MGHAQVQAYLESYADAFDLRGMIACGAEVASVRPLLGPEQGPSRDFTVFDGREGGPEPRWEVEVKRAVSDGGGCASFCGLSLCQDATCVGLLGRVGVEEVVVPHRPPTH
jgi:hypothetical protein